jgi:hypothetical protein
MSYHSLQDVLDEIEDGLLVKGMVPTALMDFVDESNIDSVIAGLPSDHRAFVLDWAHEVAFAPESELIHIAGVTNIGEIRPEDGGHARQSIFFGALRGWFERHTWPESERTRL